MRPSSAMPSSNMRLLYRIGLLSDGIGGSDESMRGVSDVRRFFRVTCVDPSVSVCVAVLRPALRTTAQDAQEEGQTESCHTIDRLRTTAGDERASLRPCDMATAGSGPQSEPSSLN